MQAKRAEVARQLNEPPEDWYARGAAAFQGVGGGIGNVTMSSNTIGANYLTASNVAR